MVMQLYGCEYRKLHEKFDAEALNSTYIGGFCKTHISGCFDFCGWEI